MKTESSQFPNKDDERRPLSLAKFGLYCLRRVSSDTCVVFVHGILSSGETAWGSPSWPELLKEEHNVRDVGIFVFTYETSLTSRTYSIADAADALREHFSIDELWKVPNIVFVCHSMGGIVVRRFLVANQAKLSDLDPTIGLFLVASPSLGSRDANIVSTLSFALQHTQAAALRFSQANTSLDELHRDFRTLLSSGKLCIVGRELLEDQPIKVKRWFGLWRQVVEPFSASAYFHQQGCEPLRIPGSDHVTIVKPTDARALQHLTLMRFLADLQQLADEHCEGRASDHSSLTKKEGAPLDLTTNIDQSDRSPLVLPKTEATTLDMIAQSAISPGRLASTELPSGGATPSSVYDFAIKLRSGRMLERILASRLVERHRDSLAVFTAALDKDATHHDFESIACWLRFSHKSSDRIEQIAESVCTKLKLVEPDFTRMKAELYGWSGYTWLPLVNWEQRWCREKFSWYCAKASLHAAWRDQSKNVLASLVHSCIEANGHYKSFYDRDINFFDFLSALKGIPASNSKIMLSDMVRCKAPNEMISALLHRMQVTPTVDAIPILRQLSQHTDSQVADNARTTLAFIPARTQEVRDLKRSLLVVPSEAFAVAAGVDLLEDAIGDLGALLSSNSSDAASYNAAWALGRMSRFSRDAARHLRKGALEHADKLVRSLCLIGLAIDAPREAERAIADEYTSARDMEKFCLSIAFNYTSDAREMLSLLASTSEARVYVPYMLTCFQLLFYDAMKHAAVNSPILREMLSLTDDT